MSPAKRRSGSSKAAKVTKDEPKAKKAKNGKSGDSAKAEEPKEPEKKMKSVKLKGVAPVDDQCPIKDTFHVFYEGTDVWDCMLNQTNIQNNNNKYYMIQLLEKDGGKEYAVWMRWGRVGYNGQKSLTHFHGNLDGAKSVFEKKFLDKTKNDWAERAEFEKVAGKYDLVQMDYSIENADEVDAGEKKKKKDDKDEKVPKSELAEAVQSLISLICNVKTMEQTVAEMQYDAVKAPLGKITKEQIKAGYSALKKIAEIVNAGKVNNKALMDACNEFYTRIPHEFGMKTPPVIRSNQEVKAKLELLEALGDIEVALNILSKKDLNMNPVDSSYKQLECTIAHLDKKSSDFKLIEKYITSTHGKTHTMYNMQVMDIFQLEKSMDQDRFVDHGNRMLLFHGSRLSNWAGILSQGLRIAPPEAPVTGYMFGKGVYFADMSSKSANYCWTSRSNNIGLLMLCEVSLGEPNELINACYNGDQLPKGKHSVKGMGKMAPDPKKVHKLEDGTVVPMGPGVDTSLANKTNNGFTLQYNEYIVYDVKQIKMRYLAKIKFNY